MASTNLLELHTTTKHQTVTIDGEVYPVKSGDAISLEVSFSLSRFQKQLAKLQDGDLADGSDEDMAALGSACRSLCDHILDAPQEVKDRLTDLQKVNILQVVFTEPVPTVAEPAKKSTTSKSSPRSKGSTAALRKTG